MSRARAPGAAQERAHRVFQQLLGGHGVVTTLAVIAVLAGLGWFTDAAFEWITDLGHWLEGDSVKHWLPAHRLIAVGIFVLELVVLWGLASGARRRYRPRVGSETSPAQVKGLILFLSNLTPAQAEGLDTLADGLADIADFRARQGDINWRMPLEAIAYHHPRRREVIIITSEGPGGSNQQSALFRRVVSACFAGAPFRLRTIGGLDSRYGAGLDFEDVDRVSQATDDAYESLRSAGLANADILIDVTGGQKPNAVALAEGRRIQYVACDRGTGQCHVCVYDVSYDR